MLPAVVLRKALEHCAQVIRVERLRFLSQAGQVQHLARDLILALGRQAADGFERTFKELRHTATIRRSRPALKSIEALS